LQLTKDLEETETNIKTEYEIYNSLKIGILNLYANTNKSLNNIFNIILFLISFLSLDYDILEKERREIEEKEGSFLKGKIIIKEGENV